MQEYLNENTLYATVAMYLEESSGLALVVEGAHDRLALKHHCSPELLLIEGIGGKMQVLDTARLAIQRSLQRAKFLVDRDFDAFGLQNQQLPSNVLISDTHDLFTDVLLGDKDILPRVVEVHANSSERRPNAIALNSSQVDTLIKYAGQLACDLASVRIVDKRRGLSLDFKRFSFGGLDENQLNAEAIGKEVLKRSQYHNANADQVVQDIIETREEIESLPIPCFGDHDFLGALAKSLKLHGTAISSENLRKGLILAMTCKSISGTDWFQEVQDWSALNGKSGFKCEIGRAAAA